MCEQALAFARHPLWGTQDGTFVIEIDCSNTEEGALYWVKVETFLSWKSKANDNVRLNLGQTSIQIVFRLFNKKVQKHSVGQSNSE